MTTFSKKAFKGLTTGIKVRKSRYYYQDIVESYNEDSVKNIELKKFEGLDYKIGQRVIKFNEKKLWNNTLSPNIARIIASGVDDKYYLGISNLINYDVIGSPIVSNDVVSIFSDNDYVIVPKYFNPKGDNWEIFMKVTTGDSFTDVHYILGNYDKALKADAPQLAVYADGMLHLFLSSDGSNWDIANNVISTNVLEVSTTYYVRTIFNGTNYVVSVKKDGTENWVEYINIESSVAIYGVDRYVLSIGFDSSGGVWNGSVDLKECYIKIADTIIWGNGAMHIFDAKGCLLDNNMGFNMYAYCGNGNVLLDSVDEDKEGYIWGGMVSIPSNTALYPAYEKNFDVVGMLNYTIASGINLLGFDSTNYIEIPAMKEYTSYEMVFRGNIYDQTGGHLVWGDDNSSLYIQTSSKSFGLYKSSSTIGKTVIPINTVYDFRLVWDGAISTIYTRVAVKEGEEENAWNIEATRSNDVFSGATTLRIGGPSATASYYWKGDIDLLNSYIKVDDEYYWKPLTKI